MENPPLEPHTEADAVSTALVKTQPHNDWRMGLPTLTGTRATLRELRASDAPSLLSALSDEQVTQFISPPPPTLDGLERFNAWTDRQRAAGQSVCFAIVPRSPEESEKHTAQGQHGGK